MIAINDGASIYVLDCPFDDGLDDFPAHFEVYKLSLDHQHRLDAPSWEELPQLGERIGRLSVDGLEFDASGRQAIKASFRRHIQG